MLDIVFFPRLIRRWGDGMVERDSGNKVDALTKSLPCEHPVLQRLISRLTEKLTLPVSNVVDRFKGVSKDKAAGWEPTHDRFTNETDCLKGSLPKARILLIIYTR